MPMHQSRQGDEVAAGQRQEREVWRDFLQHQAGVLYQDKEKTFHYFPRNLTIARAINA
jgi:hypothetical protein